MTAAPLPYGRQRISEDDLRAVGRALRAPLITQGPVVSEFEQAMAAYLGARHAVAFANGTAALHAAAHAAALGPGDEVLVPPITFVASANCVLYQGARPRFVDIDRGTWNLNVAAAAEQIEERTRAVVAVSFAGLPVGIGPLREHPNGVVVIEDACHALGALRDGRRVGGAGGADVTTFSLHPVKVMTTGEGGLATTEDDELAERMRAFRAHGIVREGTEADPDAGAWRYDVQGLGFNYRITDFQCALGLSQLAELDGWITRRNEIADRYRELLGEDDRIELPPQPAPGDTHAYHLFVVRVRAGARARRAAFEALRAGGIGVQVHYIPVYRFSHYRRTLGLAQDTCPEAERYYAGALSLPMFPGLEDPDIRRVVTTLTSSLS